MYLYFDSQGRLVEVINDRPVREASTNNYIYIYFEARDEHGEIIYTNSEYKLPSAYSVGNMDYEAIVDLGTTTHYTQFISSLSSIVEHRAIPFYRRRDLKFFQYGKLYEFWAIKIPDDLVAGFTGTFACSLRLYEGEEEEPVITLGLITFELEEGAMEPTAPIYQPQYNYLMNQIASNVVGAVRYNEEQILSSSQKKRARDNIDATKVTVSDSGTSVTEAKYITVEGNEYKIVDSHIDVIETEI